MIKTNRRTRAVGVVAALAAAASVLLVTSSASALPPGSAATTGLSLSTASGNKSSNYVLALASNGSTLAAGTNSCPGDGNSTPAVTWNTFIVPASFDAGTLTFTGGGDPNNAGLTYGKALFSGAVKQSNLTVNFGDGIIPIPGNFTFNALSAANIPPNGEYKIGIACMQGGQTVKYWQQLITVSNSNTGAGTFDWVRGSKPAAPVLASPLTVDNATINGSFSETAGDPAISARTITATPQGGGTTVTKSVASASAFTLGAADGVVNGKVYDVKVTVTNSIGSTDSNTVASPLVAPPARPAVTGLVAVPGVGQVTINWTAPTGPAPTGYRIAITAGGTPIAGSPFEPVGVATTFNRTGLTAGTAYVATVTPIHADPFVAGSATTSSFVPFASTILVQEIDVKRPVGNLVLTQKCGVYGALPDASDADFGTLPALSAVTSTAGITIKPTGESDSKFNQYPYPVDANGVPEATYPTSCGIDLGIGKLITTGARAGQYFTATGRINQVTVVDTRDTDPGWTINGTMSPFVNGSDSFSGNKLGWVPKMTDDSDVTLDLYDQNVTAGAVRNPAAENSTTGLKTAQPLASAPAGFGLGIATLDARLKLFIPLTAKNGTFEGTLTFTTI